MIKNSKTILIIDDNKFILKPLVMLLSGLGYLVKTATNGRNSTIMQKPFADLILLDMRLQDIKGQDGPDVCLRLKETEETKNIPVIMFSADSQGAVSAKKSGADDFIEKPFSMANLVKKIEQYI
ncbi:MAG: response regulator [Candidatus Staskawiczbacteria bacterium]|nr:response regulator [Candidatus Staskawiczbacteria bacterium]